MQCKPQHSHAAPAVSPVIDLHLAVLKALVADHGMAACRTTTEMVSKGAAKCDVTRV